MVFTYKYFSYIIFTSGSAKLLITGKEIKMPCIIWNIIIEIIVNTLRAAIAWYLLISGPPEIINTKISEFGLVTSVVVGFETDGFGVVFGEFLYSQIWFFCAFALCFLFPVLSEIQWVHLFCMASWCQGICV